ncbi:HPr kinase/phosphorylase [Paracoccus albus]|uniref:HPr kinase/phosphorylase n=1 Tax=Paracoccus albus TaxID=3017784 RepID=UPI0022F0E432|nr:HPr kinase/phosphatase C-terminal domain-containing protein [Paracoccus albus]WBU59484.1 HPr kinase/phosphatase C-terminal domain-containing protein [Paracoccus albus]
MLVSEVVESETIHGSAVQQNGRGVLILGPSGSGKSSLCVRLIALGATLIADDRIRLCRRGNAIFAEPPDQLAGLIEARRIGIMRLPYQPGSIDLVVDLGRNETERLPPNRNTHVKHVLLPLVLGPLSDHLSNTIFLLLQGGHLVPDVELLPVKP